MSIIRITVFAAALSLVCVVPLFAQTVDSLTAEVESARLDMQSLERILNELNEIDSAYAPSFPRWEMDEPNLRLRVHAAFRNRGRHFSKDDRITIISHPDSQTITDIKIGNVAYGKLFAQTLLARDLRTDLMENARDNEPPYGIKNRAVEESNPLARPVRPDWVSADFSLFGISLRFGNEWGIIGRVGNDELGYPFWSSGNASIMIAYKSIKIGGMVPINAGLERPSPGTSQVITSTTRLLNGSDGVVGEFEFEWETIRIQSESFPYAALGGKFAFGGLSGRRDENYTANLDSLYYFSAIVQGYYAFDFLFDEKQQNLNVQVGASYHKVNIGRAIVIDGAYTVFKGGEPESFIDPYLRIEYRNYRFDRFRVTAQYSRLAMFVGWAEIVPPFIYAEAKFSAVVFRNPRAWEHKTYFMGTVGFKFDF